MPTTTLLAARRWFQWLHLLVAIAATIALTYVVVQGSDGGRGGSSSWSLASSTCLLWGLYVLRRAPWMSLALLGLAAILLVITVITMSTGQG
jgi:hypothetical protein